VIASNEPRYLGHNPLGGWMVIALLAMAAAAGASGWLSVTDRFWGVKWVQELHEGLANALFTLAGLHVAGVVFTGRRQRDNLVLAMLTGRKPAPRPGDVD
jgi:cytochrome b